jgi:hypothetical protein
VKHKFERAAARPSEVGETIPCKLDRCWDEGRWAVLNSNDKVLARVRSKRQARVLARGWQSYPPCRVERYSRSKAFSQ